MKLFKKILIANRGEIAIRIIKSAKKLGIETVAIYSTPDKNALHVQQADETYQIGSENLSDSYLNIDKIINLAKETNCEAIHPGYGFLSENPKFVEACEQNKITFIGPDSKAVQLMGNKIEARKIAIKNKIPVTQGATGTKNELFKKAQKAKFPILVKAAAGGGGKGMRIVRSVDELEEALETTAREAKNYFDNEAIYFEQYLENPRHIEIQILADKHENIIHLYERECSIQRRHQKIIEESPSPTLNQEIREKMGTAAINLVKAINYTNAGTIEFLVDKDLNFYFLEMNTRIQVEHPVTEMVTEIDLVEQQILIAAGNPLTISQSEITQNGHAIECRIYAENPENNFLPSPGNITYYHQPEKTDNLRIDTSIEKPETIHSFYDPMIAKFIVWDRNREMARKNSSQLLKQYFISGIDTNILYLNHLLNKSDFIKNKISTTYCDTNSEKINLELKYKKEITSLEIPTLLFLLHNLNQKKANSVWNQIGFWRHISELKITINEKEFVVKFQNKSKNIYQFNLNNKIYNCEILILDKNSITAKINGKKYYSAISAVQNGGSEIIFDLMKFAIKRHDLLDENFENISLNETSEANGGNLISAPMFGKVIKIAKQENDEVKKGDTLLIIEAMKMENNIKATKDGTIESIKIKLNDMVETGQNLIKLIDKS